MTTDYSSTSNSVELIKTEEWKLLPHRRFCGQAKAAQAYLKSVESAGNTLNYSSKNKEGHLWQIVAWPLEWDSRFFAFKTARLDLIAPASHVFNKANEELGKSFINETLVELSNRGFELLTAQIDVSDTAAAQCLEQNGFLLVDTIVGYELALANWSSGVNGHIAPAQLEDEIPLRAIAAECFKDRDSNVNRFNSELKFSQSQISEMYELWIANSLTGKLADHVLIYRENGEPLGFITIKLPSDNERSLGINCATIPLNAVNRMHQGKGIYKQLVGAALSWLAERNIDLVQIKTQLPNLAVHSCWQRLGGRIYTSYHTFQKDLTRN